MAEKGIAPLIVYLDQNAWIELARIFFKKTPSDKGKILLDKIQKSVDENRAIFPITLTNYDEALKIHKIERRKMLAYYVFKISQGYSFQPWLKSNIQIEIMNVILEKLKLPKIKMRNLILQQGFSNLVGGKATIEQKDGNPLPKDVVDQLLILTETSFAMNYILNVSPPVNFEVDQSAIDVMEKNRELLLKIKDKKLRYKTFMAWNFIEMIVPELAKITIAWNLPQDFIISNKCTEEDINSFLDSIPSALCLFTLLYQRDQLKDRKIEANDFNDVMFLSLAIPYSDIVITEKLWKTISRGSKLDLKCNTKVFSSIYDLLPFL